ncbi:MAG: FAD-dependent oxidoreductase, partial [Planctomycetaceae bacterium]|nr:FAD-dependent oxidoreductase [Planctomycetaceae bacterium]
MTEPFQIDPSDEYNQQLVNQVHPPDWINPQLDGRYNLVVIGAGTAGLVTAAGAAGLGAKVALIERHLMGGDCLNTGCVPSKAIIRSARALHAITKSNDLGIEVDSESVAVNFPHVMERMRQLRADISRHDSAQRFKDLGVDVFIGDASFLNRSTIQVEQQQLDFKKAVIATGARAAVPEIEGLKETGFLTNETVFSLTELPPRLAILGAGPIGCELAQTFARFGSDVTLIQSQAQILPREDRDAAQIIQSQLEQEGVKILL